MAAKKKQAKKKESVSVDTRYHNYDSWKQEKDRLTKERDTKEKETKK